MRKLIAATLLAFAVGFVPACKKPDPNKWSTHIEAIKDPGSRAQGFSGLERLVKAVATAKDNKTQFEAFGKEVVPAFDEIWDEAEEQQTKMLQVLLDMGHPAGASVWNRALGLDGSSEARDRTKMALQGIDKAKAVDSVEAVVAEFEKVVADPKNDGGEKAGEMRLLMAKTLGTLGDKRAVPALIKAMEQTVDKQPVAVHRAAAEALGQIADPSATEALITVTYRVPDVPTSTNIGEKAKQALAAIGEPATPKVLSMFKGEHDKVNDLASTAGLQQYNVQMAGAALLGVMGRESAVDDLIAYMPRDGCATDEPAEDDKKKKPKKDGEEEEPAVDENAGNVRAVIANSLGLIGDEKAVAALCPCAKSTKNPGDMFPIAEALGRIGGTAAVDCLVDVIKTGEYDQEAVANSDFIHQIRWEAARFGLHAANADEIGKVKAAIEAASSEPKVAEEMKAWTSGIAVVEECKKDKDCYLGKLKDAGQDWIVREKAAFELMRMAPGDKAVAVEIAKAYKVRNPDARVTMVWAVASMMGDGDTKCPECVDAIEKIMDAEKDSRLDKAYQLSVLTARYTLAKLRTPGGAGDEGGGGDGGGEEAKAEKKEE